MRNATLYDGWEPSRPEVNGRSYLVHLPPIGIGTTEVESLTGYIARLAAAHAVETGVLVHRELLPRIPRTRGVSAGQLRVKMPAYSCEAHVLNGSGDRSRPWISLLEQLTCIDRLDLLTALPWATTISCVHLLRSHPAWCSSCYGEKPLQAESVYERLLWAFQVVTVCPVHGWPLDTVCPSCGRTQPVLSAKLRPGHCSQYQCWLGRADIANTFGDHVTEQIRVAEMVGQLLAIIVQHLTHVHALAKRLRSNVPPCVTLDDLIGAGTIGLIQAVDRFQPSRGLQFATYAKHRIRGAILDFLREEDPLSRTERRRARTANTTAEGALPTTISLEQLPTQQQREYAPARCFSTRFADRVDLDRARQCLSERETESSRSCLISTGRTVTLHLNSV